MSTARRIDAREYDYLVPKHVGREGVHCVSEADFAALREFVLGNRGDGDDGVELMRLCVVPGLGEALQLRNYVGVIELKDGLQIEVLPKIDTSHNSAASERSIFLRMLAELGGNLPFKSIERASVSSDRLPIFEVFVAMFLEECSRLVRAGLRSAYGEVGSRESYVRGRIDFSQQVRESSIHAELVHVIHDELVPDRPENRLIKTALDYLRRRSRDFDNMRRITQLMPAFDGISLSRNVDADFSLCVVDRATKGYTTLLEWCRVFLKGESFTMFHGSNVATALLFPMERVFEDYIGNTLCRMGVARNRAPLRRVDLQVSTRWLFDDRRVSLRPDILCTTHEGRTVVLDTKWKMIASPKDVTVADMHQMYAYGRRYRTRDERTQHVVLLYPWHRGVRPGLMSSGRHISPDGVQVDMYFVDLSNAEKSLAELLPLISDPMSLEV